MRDRVGGSKAPRRLDVVRIKVIIVSLGAGLSAIISSLSGITPQASFTPMLRWMLGFSAAKSQATAMRVVAGSAIACVVGALWRSSIMAVIAPGTDPRLKQINMAHAVPVEFALTVASLFIGSTVGAILTAKVAPKPDMVSLRRSFLFAGVCIGLYVSVDATHLSALTTTITPLVKSTGAFLLLGLISGALTQILGLASGVILVPSLYYFAGLSIQQSILVSLTVIGLAALLPAWSYSRRGLGDMKYGAAGMVGGIGFGFLGGVVLIGAPAKLLLMLFGLMAMFFSAREISIVAMDQTLNPSDSSNPPKPMGPDLS
jgi:hypothetical protein